MATELTQLTEVKLAVNQTDEDVMDEMTGRLLQAASRNDCTRLLELLRNGARASATDYDKRCGLHLAAAEGCVEAVELLMEHQADVNQRDRFGLAPLDEAIQNGNHHIAELLKQGGAEMGKLGKLEGDLIQAAHDGNYEAAEQLLKHVDPNCADYDRRTPLHLAVAVNDTRMAKSLLDHKANPMAEDRWGQTALKEVQRHKNRTGKNPMEELFAGFLTEQSKSGINAFTIMFTGLQILIVVLFFVATTYGDGTGGGDEAAAAAKGSPGGLTDQGSMALYPYFQDVNVMIFIGFGYLMTFLRKNAYNSLGLTFLVAAFVIEWHMLAGGFMHQVFCNMQGGDHCEWHKIALNLESMVLADFCAGAVLITYGALLGKVTPFQLLIIAVFEVVFFSLNENIGLTLGITDIGGSMVVHMFGAYFGMAASMVLRNKNASGNDNNAAVYHSDMLAMIGTVFLWLFWPSFNGAFGEGVQQQRVVVNTFISLSGSCVAAFLASHVLRKGVFNMVDVQNATLAGGVAMGTCADMLVGPGGAVLIGSLSGVLSVVGYVYVQPYLEDKIGFHDTCGVNNLHGLPSIMGALAGVITASQASLEAYGELQLGRIFPAVASGDKTAGDQALTQLLFLVITLGVSLVSGAITGLLVSKLAPSEEDDLFTDDAAWEVPELETPYFFDHRGEVQRDATNGHGQTAKVGLETRLRKMEEAMTNMRSRFEKRARAGSVATMQMQGSSQIEEVFTKLLEKMK